MIEADREAAIESVARYGRKRLADVPLNAADRDRLFRTLFGSGR